MSLEVIGTGFGRTGTNSLKLALEHLGFGPCHHMYEVREHPEQLPYWQQASRGDLPDWDKVYVNYRACVDWPSAHFWRELCAYYPNAKIIHSIRDEQSWFNSVQKTIYPAMKQWPDLAPGPRRERVKMAYEIVVDQTFAGRLDDQDHAIQVFRQHTENVRNTIDQERLLVYEISQGWEPLCAFLSVPIPTIPIPRVNTGETFHQRPKN